MCGISGFLDRPGARTDDDMRELARRMAISPLRLLAPGPSRGALFAIALSGAFLLGIAYDGRYGIGFGDASSARICDRGDLALTDLGWNLFSFLAFLAALGRLIAVRAKGVVWPRVIVAGAAIVCIFAPLLAFAAERSGSRRGRTEAPPQFPSTSLTSGYLLSPIMAGIGAFETKSSGWWRGAYYIFPERLYRPTAEQGPLNAGGTFGDDTVEDMSQFRNEFEVEVPLGLPPTPIPEPVSASPTAAVASSVSAQPSSRPISGETAATTSARPATATIGASITATASKSPGLLAPPVPTPIPYSRTRAARLEAAALPIHRASTALYAGLALVLWLGGSLLERSSRRSATAS
jgi:hypothetical protein